MAVFTVHIPRLASGTAALTADRVKFVADKFSWPALFFGPFWLIWHRMWWVLAGLLLGFAAISTLTAFAGLGDWAMGGIAITCLFFLAMEAANLRSWSLARQGYDLATVIAGQNVDECEVKFFGQWPLRSPLPASTEGSPSLHTETRFARPKPDETGVIGVFPSSGARQ